MGMRTLAMAVTCAASLELSGCTLLGAGIGASLDASAQRGPDGRVQAGKDDTLMVTLHDGRSIKGRYAGMHGPRSDDPRSYLYVRPSDSATVAIPHDQIAEVAVRARTTGLWTGIVMGAMVDVVLIVLTASAVDDIELR